FDGTTYWGVFRIGHSSSESGPAGASGTHRAVLRADGSLAVHGEFTSGRSGSFDTVWKPRRIGAPFGRSEAPKPLFENPIWPPPSPPEGDPRVEHPIWPPETQPPPGELP